jgi:tetratricopeptide (TPR) repeat protein
VEPASAPAPELRDVPFFPQERYHCGPAALATVLVFAGVSTTPDALAPKVYLPGRRGSLQTELIAAARQHERVPYRLEPTLAAIAAEVRAGRPVLVLQNLGLRSLPRWHYAVVVAIEPQSEAVILRSGKRPRAQVSMRSFMRTWRRADSWALVALRPGELPAQPHPARLAAAAASLEAVGRIEAARATYRVIADHWPAEATAWIGLGNTAYRLGARDAAELAYRQALVLDPQSAPVLNNLAQVMVDRGCGEAALALLRRARETPGSSAFAADIESTTRAAESAPARAGGPACGARE